MKKLILVGAALRADDRHAHSPTTFLVDMKGPGAGNPFWAAVEAGAKEKGKELGVEVVVLSPPAESDVAGADRPDRGQIAKGLDGIALAPTDPNALAPVVDAAKAKGIPRRLRRYQGHQ